MRRLLLIGVVWLALVACGGADGGSTTPTVELTAGACITRSATVENVPCDDPSAEYRLVRSALSLTDPEPTCDEGEVLLEFERTFTGGALAGGSQGVDSWCAVPV